jgi:hypothetical protein
MHLDSACIIGLLLVLICLRIDLVEVFTSRTQKCNDIDKRCYPIVDSFDANSFQEASDMLAYLNNFSIAILRHMRQKYLWQQPTPSEHRTKMTLLLLENYNPDSIIENNPINDVNTSYVEDKGRVFAVCLREKDSGRAMIHDKNILEFVVMHEMAHLSTHVIGHDDVEFWANFKILIEEAKELGLHTPVNYSKQPVVYCSLKVDYNPYFDDRMPTW